MASASYLCSSDTNPSKDPSSAGERLRLCRGIIFQFNCSLFLFNYWKTLSFISLKYEIHSVPVMETNCFCDDEDRCVPLYFLASRNRLENYQASFFDGSLILIYQYTNFALM